MACEGGTYGNGTNLSSAAECTPVPFDHWAPTGAALPSGSGDEVAASPAILAAERAGHVAARTDWAKHLAMSCPSPITFSLRDAR